MANNDPTLPDDSQQSTTSGADLPTTDSSASDQQSTQPDKAIVKADASAINDRPKQPYRAASSTTPASKPLITVHNLTKTYHMGRSMDVPALRGVSLEVYPHEFVAVMGPSGSGKSTFMNLIGCLDRPTVGDYWLNGQLVSRMSNDQLAYVRNHMIGFVFQGFNLLGRANALKNVALPMVYSGLSRRERERRALRLLQLVGLGELTHHKPAELSGGRQQRVAIARALVNGPSLLLADEPTGNLDSRTGIEVLAVLQSLNEQGMTIVLVTHDANIASYAKRLVAFLDGRLVRDEPIHEPRSAKEEWLALAKEPATASTVQVKEESST